MRSKLRSLLLATNQLRANCLSRAFKAAFLLISVSLCSYQVYKISALYFSYGTTTSVSYEKVSTIAMPGITLCFPKHLLLSDQYRDQLAAENGDQPLNDTELVQHMNSLTIADQHSLMLSIGEMFNNTCRVLKPMAFGNSTGTCYMFRLIITCFKTSN